MEEKTKLPPAAPVVLRTACIISGQYYAAGETLPFQSESELPPNLQGLTATGDEDFFSHSERNIYHQPGPEPGGPVVFQQTGGGSQWRQARQVAGSLQEQAWAEEQARADSVLPPETEAALADIHDKASALAKAQIQFNRDAVDAAYEQAAAEAAAKVVQLFVKRGGEMGKVERAKLKPGEPVFVRRENGQMEVVGHVDSNGEPPPQEIIL